MARSAEKRGFNLIETNRGILVTGVAGFTGSNLADRLLSGDIVSPV